MLERGDRPGGAIRAAELTVPGYHHDVFSGWHPLFTGSSAYASLATDLGAKGLTYLNTEHPTATLQPVAPPAIPSWKAMKLQERFAREVIPLVKPRRRRRREHLEQQPANA